MTLPVDGLYHESETPQAPGPGWRVRVACALFLELLAVLDAERQAAAVRRRRAQTKGQP